MASAEDIGIDLGSSNVLIHTRRSGIVLNEPALLALDHDLHNVIAIGTEAHRMMGREPANIEVIRPLAKGTIQDFAMLGILLNHFVVRVIGKRFFSRPRAALSFSCAANELERRQLILTMIEAGARRTHLVERPLAAALGADGNLGEGRGRMVADIGAATTDIAVIVSGELVARSVSEAAGDAFTDAIIRYVRLKHNLLIGYRTAEDLKCSIGSVQRGSEAGIALPVAGRNLVSGLPKQMDISAQEVAEAMEDPLRQLIEAFQSVLERVPPELANDVFEKGILLTGGGARLKGLQESVAEALQIPCGTAEQPQECVARGCGYVLEHIGEYERLMGEMRRKRRP